MSATAAVLLGLLTLPQAFGYSVVYDGHHWHKFQQVGRGFDPEMIHRHVYNLGEYCPQEGRMMYFGDEVVVMTQRPWEKIYAAGVHCTMNITGSDPDVGVLVTVMTSDTPDCGDNLKIDRTTRNDPNEEMFCGPSINVTGRSENYMNETVYLRWNSIPRDTKKPAAGIKVLLTAFQTECKIRQACFPCANGFVIDQVHMCNGFNNCGDNSDEIGCPSNQYPTVYVSTGSALPAAFAVCVIICLAIMGVLGFFVRKFYNKSIMFERQVNAEGENLVDQQNQQNQQV